MSPELVAEVFWQSFLANPTQWWDNRWSRHPDVRHKNFTVAQWLDNRNKPAWVEPQLVSSSTGMKKPPESLFSAVEGREAFGTETALKGQKCEDGWITEAVDALNLLVQRGWYVPKDLFYRILKRSIAHKDLVSGRQIHALIVNCGYEGDPFFATHLIGLYSSHGKLEEAMQVFTKVTTPSSYNWATIIFAFARHGEASRAIRLYRQMHLSSTVDTTDYIYVAVLKACAAAGDLVAGKELHGHILASPRKPNIFVETGLVDMYAKCGSLADARRVFDGLSQRDVVTWTAMIAGYAQQGMGAEALSLYHSMQRDGLNPPGFVTYMCLLQACASVGIRALYQGKQLHEHIEDRGLELNGVLGVSLVNMYVKCGSLEDAQSVFDGLPDRNVVAWNVILAGYVQQGMGKRALELRIKMQQEGTSTPNSVTFVSLLRACAIIGVGALRHGKQLHAQIEERRLQYEGIVGGSLVNMYAKCGRLDDARRVFDSLPTKNVVTWNAMIAGYSQQEMGQAALNLYSGMQQEGMTAPDSVTFVCLLQACASVGDSAVHQGMQLHAQIQERGMQNDVVLGGSLVNMYVKCSSTLDDARRVFDRLPEKNVVTWTAMIAGYAQQGIGEEALALYTSMQQEGITPPDSVTFVCLLQACTSVGVGSLHQGKQLHAQIEEQGLHNDVVVGGSLVNMYAKCGSLEDARRVFDSLPARNVVTCNAMIAGYAQQEMAQEALNLYSGMQEEGITPPDSVTFVCLLQACAVLAASPLGRQLHTQIEEQGMQTDPSVGAALVNMYAKCGGMFDAQQVFDSLPKRIIEAWNGLIGGYARQGDSAVVFDLVHRMRLEGIQPDSITFLCVLTVCSHGGLVDAGRKYFSVMSTGHGISPSVEHYTCMIDLLGRAGHLDEALEMAITMPLPPDGAIWLILLAACRKWRNVEIGQVAFENAVSADVKDAASYVLMSNIFASAHMWEAAKEIQARRMTSGAWKKPGQCWWTDMGGVVHTFVVGDEQQSWNNVRPERRIMERIFAAP